MDSPAVVLVGRRCVDNLNLGLSYLQASLASAEIGCRVCVLNYWQQMEAICEVVLDAHPLLVGLSLADGGSAFLPLGLGELLRRRGYAGHITCGGQFATHARAWLLDRYTWLDSVVRHAGEIPLVQLARALQGQGDFGTAVPGVTTRAGDGHPAPVMDPTPLRLVPCRDEDLPTLLGHRVAHVAATRGCAGRCTYCAPAALLALERREARQAGATPVEIQRSGVGGVKRRDLDEVCGELATLYHERDVRYVYFVDEHLLPYQPGEASRMLDRLRAGLRRRRADRLGIGTMLRADRVWRVIRAFVKAGLVRLFLGIEFGTEAEARRYGRATELSRVPALLEALRRGGVATVSDLMLVHPYATPETVDAGLRFLARLPAGLCEINQMMVYHGTRLHARLRAEGRLTGNPLRYGYRLDDPVMDRFQASFHRLRAEAFSDYSVVFRSHDAALAVALARRLRPDLASPELEGRLEQVCRQIRTLYGRALHQALGLARRGTSGEAVDELVGAAAEVALALMTELEAILEDVAAATGQPARAFSPMRAAASAAIGFAMVGLSAAACTTRSVPSDGQSAALDGRPPVADQRRSDARVCTAALSRQQREAVKQQVAQSVPCFSGTIHYPATEGDPKIARRSGIMNPYNYSHCSDPASDKKLEAEAVAVAKAIAGLPHECLLPSTIDVKGKSDEDWRAMDNALKPCAAGDLYVNKLHGAMIVLDESGTVLDVVARPGKNPEPEALACMKKALANLTFPCLAGLKVCPEFVIVE